MSTEYVSASLAGVRFGAGETRLGGAGGCRTGALVFASTALVVVVEVVLLVEAVAVAEVVAVVAADAVVEVAAVAAAGALPAVLAV